MGNQETEGSMKGSQRIHWGLGGGRGSLKRQSKAGDGKKPTFRISSFRADGGMEGAWARRERPGMLPAAVSGRPQGSVERQHL